MTLGRISLLIEDAGEICGGENACGFSFEVLITQEGINAFCHPVGFEDIGIFEDGMLAEIEK